MGALSKIESLNYSFIAHLHLIGITIRTEGYPDSTDYYTEEYCRKVINYIQQGLSDGYKPNFLAVDVLANHLESEERPLFFHNIEI